jgi:hypothetical protein
MMKPVGRNVDELFAAVFGYERGSGQPLSRDELRERVSGRRSTLRLHVDGATTRSSRDPEEACQ